MPWPLLAGAAILAVGVILFLVLRKKNSGPPPKQSFNPIVPSQYYEDQTYAQKEDGSKIKLFCTEGTLQGSIFELGQEGGVIGSDAEAKIVLKDRAVAPKHAEILFSEGKFLLRCLPGADPFSHNDQPVSEARLSPGDTIKIGGSTFKVGS